PDHLVSDENVGNLGRSLAKKLNCCSIIACNYPIDANKCLESDYSVQIAKWKPSVLVEIHGHAGRGSKSRVVEISCGSEERNELSVALAKKLTSYVRNIRGLKDIR